MDKIIIVGKLIVYLLLLRLLGLTDRYIDNAFVLVVDDDLLRNLYYLLVPLLFCVIGALFGFEYIITIFKTSGILKFNFNRLVILVLPLFIVSYGISFYYSNTHVFRMFGDLLNQFQLIRGIDRVVQLLVGILLVSCFARTKEVVK